MMEEDGCGGGGRLSALDVVIAGLGGQGLLVQIVKVGVEEGPPGRDPLGGIVDQHLK